MDNKSAVKPDVFLSFSDIKETRSPEQIKKENDPEDVALSAMSRHNGWPVLKKRIERVEEQMDELVNTLIANGGTFEEIGKITVVSNLAKEKLNDIIKWVEDSAELFE